MINFKHRWSTAFGGSLLFHGGGFLVIALLAGFFISSIPKQGPIEVDLVAGGGGGGGGGAAIESATTSSASPPPEQMVEEPKEVFNDIHEIEKEYRESNQSDLVQNRTSINRNTSISSSESGAGTGSVSGNGNGQGSGTGAGTGVGSGTGSGYGSGTGSGVGEGDGNTVGPQVLNAVEPVFPESERTAGVSGTAMVGLTIDVDGSVSSAWIESSTGSSVLDGAAVSAVYQWRFIPAKQGGIPIQSRSRVPIIFKYRN